MGTSEARKATNAATTKASNMARKQSLQMEDKTPLLLHAAKYLEQQEAASEKNEDTKIADYMTKPGVPLPRKLQTLTYDGPLQMLSNVANTVQEEQQEADKAWADRRWFMPYQDRRIYVCGTVGCSLALAHQSELKRHTEKFGHAYLYEDEVNN
ncbi:hypothetical protein BDW22DRAFT_157306 [Trametopsis cervina]|nr:hypothetical protein BDW22DRAFT_157306 [Trametopsis cervina]